MSNRSYLTIDELEQFADITVTDDTEAEDQISQAEELIDSYVGFQEKAIECEYRGLATGGGATTINLSIEHQNIFEVNYLIYCEVEIIGGTGAGQKRMISSSTKEGVVTVSEAWTTNPDSTSYYRIFQLGCFPRLEDSQFDSQNTPNKYYKFIPEKVKRAVASQVEYKIKMGDDFFSTNKMAMRSESIGDYSYSKFGGNASRLDDLIAPKAKMLLNGIRNIVGVIEV